MGFNVSVARAAVEAAGDEEGEARVRPFSTASTIRLLQRSCSLCEVSLHWRMGRAAWRCHHQWSL